MKKSLLAIAAMTAFAGAAQAQSSVTVYGILDVGFVGSNYSGTAIAANGNNINSNAAGSATQKQTAAGFGQSAESTSRIGFKGSEDLGGGTSAIFTIEMGLSPNSEGQGSYSTTTLRSSSGAFGQINRQTFVGLKKNGLGTASIGTQYTPMFDVQSITDAAGNNNLLGNAVYSGSLQSTTGTFNFGQGPYAATANQSLNGYTGAYTTRTSNALKLQSDRVAGFAGQIFYAQANANTTANQNATGGYSAGAGGVNNATVRGANIDYVWNKLQVVGAYQGLRAYDQNPFAGQTTASTTWAAGTADSFGNNANDNQYYAAATYDFGIAKAYYQYVRRSVISTIDSSFSTRRSANQLGVRSQLTPTISAYGTYGLGNSAYYGNGISGANIGANFRTYQLGLDYNLSKRTNLYAAVGAVNQSSNGNAAANTTLATQGAAGGVGVTASNYAVGVRHTF